MEDAGKRRDLMGKEKQVGNERILVVRMGA